MCYMWYFILGLWGFFALGMIQPEQLPGRHFSSSYDRAAAVWKSQAIKNISATLAIEDPDSHRALLDKAFTGNIETNKKLMRLASQHDDPDLAKQTLHTILYNINHNWTPAVAVRFFTEEEQLNRTIRPLAEKEALYMLVRMGLALHNQSKETPDKKMTIPLVQKLFKEGYTALYAAQDKKLAEAAPIIMQWYREHQELIKQAGLHPEACKIIRSTKSISGWDVATPLYVASATQSSQSKKPKPYVMSNRLQKLFDTFVEKGDSDVLHQFVEKTVTGLRSCDTSHIEFLHTMLTTGVAYQPLLSKDRDCVVEVLHNTGVALPAAKLYEGSTFSKALHLYDMGKSQEAVCALQAIIEAGDSAEAGYARLFLADLYLHGKGVKQSDYEAWKQVNDLLVSYRFKYPYEQHYSIDAVLVPLFEKGYKPAAYTFLSMGLYGAMSMPEDVCTKCFSLLANLEQEIIRKDDHPAFHCLFESNLLDTIQNIKDSRLKLGITSRVALWMARRLEKVLQPKIVDARAVNAIAGALRIFESHLLERMNDAIEKKENRLILNESTYLADLTGILANLNTSKDMAEIIKSCPSLNTVHRLLIILKLAGKDIYDTDYMTGLRVLNKAAHYDGLARALLQKYKAFHDNCLYGVENSFVEGEEKVISDVIRPLYDARFYYYAGNVPKLLHYVRQFITRARRMLSPADYEKVSMECGMEELIMYLRIVAGLNQDNGEDRMQQSLNDLRARMLCYAHYSYIAETMHDVENKTKYKEIAQACLKPLFENDPLGTLSYLLDEYELHHILKPDINYAVGQFMRMAQRTEYMKVRYPKHRPKMDQLYHRIMGLLGSHKDGAALEKMLNTSYTPLYM